VLAITALGSLSLAAGWLRGLLVGV
jgi:hypothetical protein